jgi:hypothetical protein
MIYKTYLLESKASLEVGRAVLKNKEFGAMIFCPEKLTLLELSENEVEELIKALNMVKNEIREGNEK